ncbi:endonuclease/exonuclease/phosphatase family protein [Fodinicola acaciae]|uniref:endonuclease/exonuclease/phosphatase family protein n=1 Tax=Fodinicola acaciae TaxID=2681555 RepID=UPI0013D38605|nr:endonuclease/exonuclease/phosphatase family protein [Fodinicola acaciae]
MRNRWMGRGLTAAVVCVLALAGLVGSGTYASAAAGLTVKVMTFNTCANTSPIDAGKPYARCVNGRSTKAVAGDLKRRLTELHPDTRVVFLQEICFADIAELRTLVGKSWNFRFAGIKDAGNGSKPSATIRPRACAQDRITHKPRGNFGIAVGVKADATFAVHYYPEKDVPQGRDFWKHWNVHQAAICADVPSFGARVCGTHLTPLFKNAPPAFKKAQENQVKDLIAYGGKGARVIVGGDLNAKPPVVDGKSSVVPLYDSYTECDQVNHNGARTGEGTFQGEKAARGSKLDYVFASKNSTNSCYVTDAIVNAADHVPVFDTITFP